MPIGLPNCRRSFAYSTASSSARWATPSASAATAVRTRGESSAPGSGSRAPSRSLPSGRGGALRRDDAVDAIEVGHESRDFDRPADLTLGDRRLLLGAERGQREHGGEVGAGVQAVAELLEQDRLFDESEPGAALVLRHGCAGPAKLDELGPRGRVPALVRVRDLRHALERQGVAQVRARTVAQLTLLLAECELHYRLLGRPSTRSAMTLRSTSDVPASIVFARLRSSWYRHSSSATAASGPISSSASAVSRWFDSDQRSFVTEPSGPGTPVCSSCASDRLFVSFSASTSIASRARRSASRPFVTPRERASATTRWSCASSAPTSENPSVARSWRSVVIATDQPAPISPSTFAAGTSTSP